MRFYQLESVSAHIKAGDGIKAIVPYLEHSETELRTSAFKLTRALSDKFGEDVANELRASDKLSILLNKIVDEQSSDGEKSDSACILANLPLSEDEVKSLVGASFVKWTVNFLRDQHRNSALRSSRTASSMTEGLLGILLHFTRTLDSQTLTGVKENCLMTVLCEQLGFTSKPRVRQLAALGLKNLSVSGRQLAVGDSEPQPPHGFCSSLLFICGRGSPEASTCPVHNTSCEEDSQLCLLKSNCVRPLANLLTDEDTSVQIAVVEALSTLVLDSSNNLKRAVDELEQLGVVDAVIALFTELRPGELQERTIWMVERILRVEGQNSRLSLNQALVRALVEAFKHGNANTKRHSQDALTNLKQISGVSGKASSQSRTRR